MNKIKALLKAGKTDAEIKKILSEEMAAPTPSKSGRIKEIMDDKSEDTQSFIIVDSQVDNGGFEQLIMNNDPAKVEGIIIEAENFIKKYAPKIWDSTYSMIFERAIEIINENLIDDEIDINKIAGILDKLDDKYYKHADVMYKEIELNYDKKSREAKDEK
jgi:hypothetical protein